MMPAMILELVLKFGDQVLKYANFTHLPSTMHFPTSRQLERKRLILQSVCDWTIFVGQWSLVEWTASLRANTILPTYVVNDTAKSAAVQRPSVGCWLGRSLEHSGLHLPVHVTPRFASLARVSLRTLTFLNLESL